ncbi:MAG: hypothetical protein KatS3mg099_383 [Candidatus Parcubacteria bacterium]|nr:MAG: hypothetical protein KatS3mg099_383 [Candidatus Parcubacteria bacterium]
MRAQRRDFTVVVAAPLAPNEIGGPASHLRWLVKEAREYLPHARLAVVGFWEVRHLPPGVRHLAYLVRLLRASKGASLLYALDPFSVGIPAMVVSRARGVPLVLRVPGDFAWEQGMLRRQVADDVEAFAAGAWRRAPWGVRVRAWLERKVAQTAALVVAPSKFVARLVEDWGVPPERVRVVPSVVRVPEPSGNKAALRAVMGIEGPLFVAVGRLVPWKHFDAAVRAVRLVRRKAPKARLIVVGDGPERAALEDLAHKEGVKDAVQFAGALPADTTHRYIEAADALVLPSSYEGLSHTLLEAMALGTLVIASRAGGNAELVEDGKHGFLVPPGDPRALAAAMSRILALPQEARERMAAAARARVREATRESKAATRIFALWQEVLH